MVSRMLGMFERSRQNFGDRLAQQGLSAAIPESTN